MKRFLQKLSRGQNTPLCVLILIIAALHFSTIMQPAKPLFDEQYYVPAAQSILHGNGTDRIEQPPLAQLIIGAGIRLFGDNPFGWRFLPVVFGITGLVIFYFICLRLNMTRKYAWFATFLLSFENLTFVQSGIAMLDVFSLTFILASFWFYLKERYAWSGAMVALATLSKFTAVLAIPTLILFWLLTDRKRWNGLFMPGLWAVITFWLLMPPFDLIIWHKWLNPVVQLQMMLNANALATFARFPGDAMMSRPWDWLARPVILTYWINPHYLAMISPPVWALIVPSIVLAFTKIWKRSQPAGFSLAWFAGTYLAWIPLSLITDRISYIFYFFPAVGSVCIAISLAFSDLSGFMSKMRPGPASKLLALFPPMYLLLCLGTFVILSPVGFWWKVPLCAAAYVASRYFLRDEQFNRFEKPERELIHVS